MPSASLLATRYQCYCMKKHKFLRSPLLYTVKKTKHRNSIRKSAMVGGHAIVVNVTAMLQKSWNFILVSKFNKELEFYW